MSSRQMRRQKLAASASSVGKPGPAKEKPTVEEESSEEDDAAPVIFSNPFDLLGGGGGGIDDDGAEEEEEEEEKPVQKEKAPSKPANKGQHSKKQNAKQGKKSENPANTNAPPAKKEEDIDEILKEFAAQDRRAPDMNQTEAKTKQLLQIDSKYLDPTFEIKQMFGSKVFQADGKPNRGQQQQRRASMRSKRVTPAKRTFLVKPREYWPQAADGQTMELVETKKGINYFKFNWSNTYKDIQRQFFGCVQTGDPNTLAALLQRHPYHIDSILQLYEALKITGERDSAEDLLERLLYRFEALWHPKFDPVTQGNNRLPYQHQENRGFYIGLYTRLELLGRRGCIKTALEIAKLMLTMDLSDPMGMLYLIDHYALRTKSYEFLLRLYSSPMFEEKALSTSPNWLFSVALAMYHLEKKTIDADEKAAMAKLPDASSASLLQHAIIMFPQMAPYLMNKLAIPLIGRDDASGSSVDILKDHPFFVNAEKNNTDALKVTIALYVERNIALWRDPPIVTWLKDNILATVAWVKEEPQAATNCEAIVKESFESFPDSLKRHILLSDTIDLVRMLPANVVRDGFRIYDDPVLPPEPQQNQGGIMNNLAQFLQTMLPWNNLQEQGGAGVNADMLAQLFGALGQGGDADDEDEE